MLSIILSAFLLQGSVASGETFRCTPTHVYDGDGPIWCAEGPKIRLAGIAAREIDNSCSPGHPCPKATGIQARDALVRLVGTPIGTGPKGHILVKGPTMTCTSTGNAKGSRTGAWCISPRGGDINCAMVKNGMAARWDKFWGNKRCN